METIVDVIIKILDEAREAIQANMATRYRTASGETRWVNASGRSSAAFRVERYDGGVRLVYEGTDVAPLESIQEGQDGSDIPKAAELQRWWKSKTGEELEEGVAIAMVKSIAARGTERWREPQNWIIDPVVNEAADRIAREASAAYLKDILTMFDA